jgi:hypothetical protein
MKNYNPSSNFTLLIYIAFIDVKQGTGGSIDVFPLLFNQLFYLT